MGLCGSDPPPPPDYLGAAQAQGTENRQTAASQSRLNNPNVISPYGTQTVSYGTFDQPGYNRALSNYADEMNAYNAQPLTQSQGGRVWNPNVGGSGRGQWVTNPTTGGTRQGTAPVAPTEAQFTTNAESPTITQTFSPEQQALYDQSVATQQQLGRVAGQGATALEGVVGKPVDFSGAPRTGDYGATRQKVIDAYMSRANEDYGKQTDQSNSDLVARGIPMGSKAYGDQQQMIERSRNDARQQAEISGGNAASQAYGMDSDRRRQAITEQLAQRQTPINEISALLSGSQVSNPFSTPGYAQNTQVAQTPLFAANQAAGQYGTDVYNAQQAQSGNMQSGLFGLGGAGIMGGAMLL